jgi:Asp-tRNA(Asn)/Glu-tRNA(Gln) amidotransferase C subunit
MARKSANEIVAKLAKMKVKEEAVEAGFAAIEDLEQEIEKLRAEKQTIRAHIREIEGPIPRKDRTTTQFKTGKVGEEPKVIASA